MTQRLAARMNGRIAGHFVLDPPFGVSFSQ